VKRRTALFGRSGLRGTAAQVLDFHDNSGKFRLSFWSRSRGVYCHRAATLKCAQLAGKSPPVRCAHRRPRPLADLRRASRTESNQIKPFSSLTLTLARQDRETCRAFFGLLIDVRLVLMTVGTASGERLTHSLEERARVRWCLIAPSQTKSNQFGQGGLDKKGPT
jgi:hypothetical protein